MPDDESGNIDASGSVTLSKMGGVDDGVPWVGGSFIDKSTEPQDVFCHCPTTFKEKQKQHGDLKRVWMTATSLILSMEPRQQWVSQCGSLG